MGDKLLFALALLLILAGIVSVDTPWFSNTGPAAWLIRFVLAGTGLVLCLLGMVINRRKKDTTTHGEESQS